MHSTRLWALLVVAACGGSDDGALLTIHAPDGPGAATRLEIILASADATTITTIDGQRMMPGALAEESARYYRQRAKGGEVAAVATLDGFVIRIEPELAVADDPMLIPFLVAYDDDTIIGIGAVLDARGEPGPVEILPGRVSKYVVELVPMTPATGAIESGQHLEVACETWRSGIAWRPGDGTQLRLLLPDLAADPSATDARTRPLDLDCDAHDAPDADCDDLRANYHAGPQDACDGEDTNCDGQRLLVQQCPLEAGVCDTGPAMGVQLCDDTTGQPIGTCASDPACACRNGDPTCHRCMLDFQPTPSPDTQSTCTPAVDSISLAAYCSANEPCTVDVLPRGGRFEAKISSEALSGFGSRVTDVHGEIFLLVKHEAGELPGVADASVGAIYLAITSGGLTRHLGIDLALASASTDQCSDFGGGFSKMQCL
jgi:hypothetical protein